ncbi:MAG: MarR family transcriptional regulator [Chloroflexi bacterium]|nr:MarR family transcriptional regulator [Chloroflexota bacterium]
MPLADRVWGLLIQVSLDRVHRHFALTAAELELAPAQALALQQLQTDCPISMRELAARLKCDPSNITGLIDRLEIRGLVERRAHPADRRVKYLLLTGAGQDLRERLEARLFSAPRFISELLEHEQAALSKLLAEILGERRT